MMKMPSKSHLLLILPYLFLACFITITFYYIYYHHLSALSRDQWHMYAVYFEKGPWQAALTPMSTHRHLFPFIFFNIDMKYFGGLNHFLTLAGAIFDICILLLITLSLKNEPALSSTEKHAIFIFLAASFLWLINIAQLGWGFMSTQYYLAIFTYLFSITAAYCSVNLCQPTNHRGYLWLFISIVSGIVCTFSFGMGILVWPALLFLGYLWKTGAGFFLTIAISLVGCLFVFFLMPGGNSIEEALLFQPKYTLGFLFELPGGPVYYLLRSGHFLDIDSIKLIAVNAGVLVTAIAILLLLLALKRRPATSLFTTLCFSLVLLGLGTAALISFTRNPFFLDVWVDRYQIWATLFWSGFLPIFYLSFKDHKKLSLTFNRSLLFFMCLFPALAIPSQLDMGARLAEYNTRVRQALLSFQVGIPEKNAAEDALHWNWENKLDDFFYVWSNIKASGKNIFLSDHSDYLGKQIDTLISNRERENIDISVKRSYAISRDDLLDLGKIKFLSGYECFDLPKTQTVIGYKIFAKTNTITPWDYALAVNESGTVIGLAIRVDQSILPRSHLKYTYGNYNLFSIVRANNAQGLRYYFFDAKDDKVVYVSRQFEISH